jgi:multidrug resistance efflux pump
MAENRLTTVRRTSVPARRTPLAPIAYSETVMPALRLVRSSRIARRISNVLVGFLIATIGLMTMAPWQQTVSGTGNVLAFAPDKRQQTIQSPITGKIYRWGEGITENAKVKAGDEIAEIRDLDENYATRLDDQLRNVTQAVTASEQSLAANKRVYDASLSIVDSFKAQVDAYTKVKVETIAAQDAFVEMAKKKVDAENEQLLEYEAALPQLEAEFERMKILEQEQNVSLQKFQEVERKFKEAQAKVKRAQAYVASAEADLEGKTRERVAKIQRAQVDIDYAEATLRKATGDISKAQSDVAKSEQDLNKAKKDLLEMETTVARQGSRVITAPFDGYLVSINANLGTGVLKAGDPLATIVPATADRSVQIWLNGNDAPLVEPNRHVRLQFEGWPAIQFAGWPSVAVGTFGGKVISVDAVDDGKGKFRILVVPDPTDIEWPEDRFLRQGVRANGWVMLEQVPLWFEVWRRLNGFPPVVDVDQGSSNSDSSKMPKLPKP